MPSVEKHYPFERASVAIARVVTPRRAQAALVSIGLVSAAATTWGVLTQWSGHNAVGALIGLGAVALWARVVRYENFQPARQWRFGLGSLLAVGLVLDLFQVPFIVHVLSGSDLENLVPLGYMAAYCWVAIAAACWGPRPVLSVPIVDDADGARRPPEPIERFPVIIERGRLSFRSAASVVFGNGEGGQLDVYPGLLVVTPEPSTNPETERQPLVQHGGTVHWVRRTWYKPWFTHAFDLYDEHTGQAARITLWTRDRYYVYLAIEEAGFNMVGSVRRFSYGPDLPPREATA
jgi:hypothetical protein